ncbi:hypothetical protein EI94DRAFT_1769378 [Lactarius quietus]|nr:hypothetical protein EI94DRAFT_1769378 [Lactarius quietus]
MEEAAAVAMDYITTLDNLPAEVQHLLVEIKHKETKSQELLQEITKETSRYIRHSLRSGATPLSTKDEQIPQKIDQNYAEVDRLAQEKLKIAERLAFLIHGDDPGQPTFVSTSRNPVQEMNDNLRLAIAEAAPIAPAQKSALFDPLPPSPPPLADDSYVILERKVAATVAAASIKLPSPAPAAVPVLPQRTRLAQQQSHRASPARGRQAQPEPPGPDEDAEGEDDVEEGNGDEDEDNEDKTLYCFCQKMSYGEMVACDNAECAYQWFHLPCVNLKPPLPEVWYCSDCISKGAAGSLVDNADQSAQRSARDSYDTIHNHSRPALPVTVK